MAKILVTDDSKFLRKRICSIIDTGEHTIVEACDGEECLALLRQDPPDIIFLDLVMPVLDGFGVLEAIQAEKIDIPVVVLTADIQEGIAKRCMDLGAKAYLNKPPQAEEMLATLEKVLGG